MATDENKQDPLIVESMRKQVIEHLSREIETLSNNIMTQRTKSAFTIWIGPYFLLGSLILATNGKYHFDTTSGWFKAGATVALLCYVALGVIGSIIERHSWLQCNQWRKCILSIAKGESFNEALCLDRELPKKVRGAYFVVFILLAACFAGILGIVKSVSIVDLPEAKPVQALSSPGASAAGNSP